MSIIDSVSKSVRVGLATTALVAAAVFGGDNVQNVHAGGADSQPSAQTQTIGDSVQPPLVGITEKFFRFTMSRRTAALEQIAGQAERGNWLSGPNVPSREDYNKPASPEERWSGQMQAFAWMQKAYWEIMPKADRDKLPPGFSILREPDLGVFGPFPFSRSYQKAFSDLKQPASELATSSLVADLTPAFERAGVPTSLVGTIAGEGVLQHGFVELAENNQPSPGSYRMGVTFDSKDPNHGMLGVGISPPGT